MTAEIVERMKEAENLPSLPAVAIEVLNLTRREDFTIEELAELLQNDPAMTVRLLKVVNSSLFGLTREITSLSQAMNLLGWRTVRVMVLSFSLVAAIDSDESDDFDYKSYWRRSLTGAAAARRIAAIVAPRIAEEAFVAGLLADIGMLISARCEPDLYGPVLQKRDSSGLALQDIEKEMLGVDHAQIGSELLAYWGIPEGLCEAIAAHHAEPPCECNQSTPDLPRLVAAAMDIAELFCDETVHQDVDAVKNASKMRTGVSDEQLDALMEALDDNVRETASLLALQIGETRDYASIQAEATRRLAALSIEAEVERAATDRDARNARQEVTRLREENKTILEIAATDILTQIPNRAAFDQRMEEAIRRVSTNSESISLILLDIDHFKETNDTHGHLLGDEVLRLVGMILYKATKDIGFAARYGGEEFAILLSGSAAEHAVELADGIRRMIESASVSSGGQQVQTSASLGVASILNPRGAIVATDLVEEADRCLYRAKRGGRNRVESCHLSLAA